MCALGVTHRVVGQNNKACLFAYNNIYSPAIQSGNLTVFSRTVLHVLQVGCR